MKQFRIKPGVDPHVLYKFGFVYRGNWARGELYQKEIPALKGKGNGISINFDLGAEISFITPYMNIKYPDIEYYIRDLIKAGYVEEIKAEDQYCLGDSKAIADKVDIGIVANKELANIQDLKSAFTSHCKTLGCEKEYIQACEKKFDIVEDAIRENIKLEEMLDNDEELIKTLERKFENELKCNQRLTKLHSDFRRASARRIHELQHYLVTLIDFLGIDNICAEKMQGTYYLFLGNNYRQMKRITEEEYNLFLKIKEEYKYGKRLENKSI